MQQPRTALVIGATGLVGSALVSALLADDRFETVHTFTRRTSGQTNAKLHEHLVHFDTIENWRALLVGDVLFSAMGTTLKQAGSKEAQYKIDYTYQHDVAKAAAANGVAHFVLVSSAGASARSRFFYPRIKGQLEEAVQTFSFPHVHLLQPGILAGSRAQKRLGETIGVRVMALARYLPGLKKYRPIPAETVAQAMINASFRTQQKSETHTLNGVFALANAR